ncbi:ABC transporter A family member 1 [Platanthera zijinensis]|uniref:ABC transporter A family member 1 n=1 Tax=Platanthera zijinensis TaxID=2320716 RepID=A0AAP0C1R7_9ASPA
MLVGLVPPTSGDALVFGKKITTDMADIRKVLGVCPQHDILFPELTVKEHLVMCAALKGVDEHCLESKVTEMIIEVGLADKVNSVVGTLSGGMKRKLSLGIALIGNSKVVILDEPTSGMDPYAMRSTWQLIKKIKKGRIILLTTHSMDEADFLGDRIAIMANGHLRCCGSSLFLKNRYGVGYTLTIAKSSPGSSVGAEIVRHHVPAAECISDVGSEVSFRLPLASSSLFVNMFREIESYIRWPNSGDNSSIVKSDRGVESYGISVTTLEEVFLKVAGQRLDEVDCYQYQISSDKSDSPDCQGSQVTPFGLSISKRFCGCSCELFIWLLCSAGKVCSLVIATIYDFTVLSLVKLCSCGTIVRSDFWVHLKALFIKRGISARRDSRTVAFQLLIPAIFMLLGLLFLRIKPHPDQDSVTLTTSHFNPLLSGGGGGGPIPFNLCFPIAEKVASHIMGGWIQREEPRSFRFPEPEKASADAIEAAGPIVGPLLLSMSEYLISSLNESYQSRYGAVVMDDQYADGSLGFTILHNSTCQHAAPTYINLVNAAILQLATGNRNKTLRIRNHPLPLTMSQHAQRHDLDAFSASIIVSMAFSFIPASFAVSIVKEREVKAKQQQLISGVSIFAYWISTYLWDFFSFLLPSSFAVFLFFIFGLNQFVGYGCLVPTIVIFLEYGAAVASSTYCLTFFFTDHSIAQNVVLLVHFLGGLILMVLSFIMGLVNATKTANSFLKNFFRLSPAFCFADGLASLALRHQDMRMASKDQILDWNVTGASLCYLAVEIVVYFVLTLSLEFTLHHKIKLTISRVWWNLFRHVKYDMSQSYSEPLLGSFGESSMFMTDEDADVTAERQRILNGLGDNAIICLQNLRKVYPAGKNHAMKIAVHSLTFAVQEGECFGFLGTNGAGKTTTLSMLTGEERPTDGTAFVFGTEVRSDPKSARRHIGYCPQFDALFEFLTAREHLQLYAKIKSVPENLINNVVNEKLEEFDLWSHAEKPSYTLSGGNKRKLSVAIAMIGDPPIVILDEPSTGMDPIAKRFMWDVISSLSTRRGKTAVILTTHSMNEAQALCTRIGIMVDGKLRCIGSPQHLKSRYGNHLELELKPTEVSTLNVDDLCKSIQELLHDFPKDARSIIGDLETCILGSSLIASKSIAEISLTTGMIILIARLFGNEDSIKTIVSSNPVSDGVFGEQLSEQLLRDDVVCLYPPPQQNGVAERKNQHFLDVARSLMIQMQVPKAYWNFALSTIFYLINPLPSSVLQNATPFSILFPSTPSFSFTPRIFGCTYYVHLLGPSTDKLDPRAAKHIFVGYSRTQKGYVCYSPTTSKVTVSADVTLREDQPLLPKPTSSTTIRPKTYHPSYLSSITAPP